MECSVGPRTVMVNVKGALVSRDVRPVTERRFQKKIHGRF